MFFLSLSKFAGRNILHYGEFMFHQIERELLNGEPWLMGQQSQPLQLLDEEEQKIGDIWEVSPQEHSNIEQVKEPKYKFLWFFRFFSKLNFLLERQ